MSLYDRYADKYTGISVDLFCFIANEIGLPYQFIGDGYQSFSEMMADFEEGAVSKAECNTVNESTLGHYHSAPALLA